MRRLQDLAVDAARLALLGLAIFVCGCCPPAESAEQTPVQLLGLEGESAIAAGVLTGMSETQRPRWRALLELAASNPHMPMGYRAPDVVFLAEFQGRDFEACRHFSRALFFRDNKPLKAIEEMTLAVEIEPRWSYAWLWRAMLIGNVAGGSEREIQAYQEGVAAAPSEELLVDLRICLKNADRPAEALAVSERLVLAYPDSVRHRWDRAKLLLESADPSAAFRDLEYVVASGTEFAPMAQARIEALRASPSAVGLTDDETR